MPRCPIVDPEVVRLYLVDVHKRALHEIQNRPKPKEDAKPDEKTAWETQQRKDEDVALAKIAQADVYGDYIEVQRKLNAGEYLALLAKNIVTGPDGRLSPDLVNQGYHKIQAYLLGWSFVDRAGQPLPIDALLSIDRDAFTDVLAAVEAHDAANETESMLLKNDLSGSRELVATSTSVAP